MSRKHVPHIAVDLDGTLAHYDTWKGVQHIGTPIPAMVERVKAALARGWKVSIFTARVSGLHDGEFGDSREAKGFIEDWCIEHLGRLLPVTAVKHGYFTEFWDDRAVRVRSNEGINVYGGALWDELG